MNLKNIDLNLFLVFDAVYSERNITRAAEILNVTQPAVSNSLNRLRQRLQDPLFVRGPNGMLPTPLSESMIDGVRQALQLLITSVQQGEKFEPALAKRYFTVSMHDVVEVSLLPALITGLQKTAPQIMINSFNVDRRDMVRELAAGSLDLAIDAPVLNNSELLHVPLFSSPYVCLVRRGHPLSGQKLTMKRYLSCAHILISGRRKGEGLVDSVLNLMGETRQIKTRMRHYLVAAKLVDRSDYVLTVPRHLAVNTDLEILDLPFDVPHQQCHLYWHRSADQDQANSWLREQIRALF